MAATTSIKLTNRSHKQPVKKLPLSVDVTSDTTIEDVKKEIAKRTGLDDFNRVGLFYPPGHKTVKNRLRQVVDVPEIMETKEIFVKDLGSQMAWRTVYIVEYLGPLLIHPLVLAARPYIYFSSVTPLSITQWIAFAMFTFHFLKRMAETLFVHRFSANTMPIRNIFKNSYYYWIFFGLMSAYTIYHPTSLAARADHPLVDAAGMALFLFAEVMNLLVHLYLSSLRPEGSTQRVIPRGYGFELVTCPNYLYEVIAWSGVVLTARSWAVTVAITQGAYQMAIWAKEKERAYRAEFGDKYKKKRYVMLPGLV